MASTRDPRYLGGPDERPDPPGLRLALRNLDAEQRPPLDSDRPPVTTFPGTRAAAEALRITREHDRARKLYA